MPDQHFIQIGKQFEAELETTTGQMFGKPCLKIDKKAFAAFFKNEMVFKLGQEEVNLLKAKYSGAVNWDPSGKNRAMKDWLQVPADFTDDWTILAKQALEYVKSLK